MTCFLNANRSLLVPINELEVVAYVRLVVSWKQGVRTRMRRSVGQIELAVFGLFAERRVLKVRHDQTYSPMILM